MKRIDWVDSGFLYMESRETPMHVGGVNLFTLPQGANQRQFMRLLGEVYRSDEELRKPFGQYVATGRLGKYGPLYWKDDTDLDLEYHVRHSALPKPGRYRELFALVSRLHGTLLDRSRPLWEAHVIEGLQKRQFAIYSKLHHATIDGVAGQRLTEGMCSTDPAETIDFSPLSMVAYQRMARGRSPSAAKPGMSMNERDLRAVAEFIREQLGTSAQVLNILKSYGETWLGRGGSLAVPFRHVPRTLINSRVSGSRRFVAQSWQVDRVKAISQAVGCTLNDVVLAMCSGALRQYLLAQHDLPQHSLRAMVPVSVRVAGDYESANAVSFITANLGTRHADPEDRIQTIMESTRTGKALLQGLTSQQASLYAGIVNLPLFLSNLLGMAERFPAFSTTISNVPGPRQRLYWNGARLDGSYPASAIFHGFALNITLVSYAGNLDFGIMACRRSVPQVQRLIDHMEDALAELEEMAGV